MRFNCPDSFWKGIPDPFNDKGVFAKFHRKCYNLLRHCQKGSDLLKLVVVLIPGTLWNGMKAWDVVWLIIKVAKGEVDSMEEFLSLIHMDHSLVERKHVTNKTGGYGVFEFIVDKLQELYNGGVNGISCWQDRLKINGKEGDTAIGKVRAKKATPEIIQATKVFKTRIDVTVALAFVWLFYNLDHTGDTIWKQILKAVLPYYLHQLEVSECEYEQRFAQFAASLNLLGDVEIECEFIQGIAAYFEAIVNQSREQVQDDGLPLDFGEFRLSMFDNDVGKFLPWIEVTNEDGTTTRESTFLAGEAEEQPEIEPEPEPELHTLESMPEDKQCIFVTGEEENAIDSEIHGHEFQFAFHTLKEDLAQCSTWNRLMKIANFAEDFYFYKRLAYSNDVGEEEYQQMDLTEQVHTLYGALSPEFGWKELPLSDVPLMNRVRRWEQRLDELRQFKQQHGHLNVKESQNPSLYAFVRDQRVYYKRWIESNRRTGPMTQERFEAFREIGLELRSKIEKRLDELRHFKQQHGHLNVKESQNPSLYNFMRDQRRHYKKWIESDRRTGPMTQERFEALREIGFEFETRAGMRRTRQQGEDRSGGRKRRRLLTHLGGG